MRLGRDDVRDELRGALDGEPDAGGRAVTGEVEGDAMELIREGRDLDRPLSTRESRPVEEDDRRPLVLAAIPRSRVRGAAGPLRRQFTSVRSTA